MCTLIVACDAWTELPLLVAANRDERLDRAAHPPATTRDGPLPILAPRDDEAGGTWLGINSVGLFVGITNRFGAEPDPDRRSRGLLVVDALTQRTPEIAANRVAALPATQHNPFHLVIADRTDAWLVWNDGAHVHRDHLGRGVHFVTERSLGAGQSARIGLLEHWRVGLDDNEPPDEEDIQRLLSRHGDDPLDSLCVHVVDWKYGTRSSTTIRLPQDLAAASMFHADGPPCTTAYEDYSGQVRALLTGPSSATLPG